MMPKGGSDNMIQGTMICLFWIAYSGMRNKLAVRNIHRLHMLFRSDAQIYFIMFLCIVSLFSYETGDHRPRLPQILKVSLV